MNTYFVSTNAHDFFTLEAERFTAEGDAIFFYSNGISFLCIYQDTVFKIEGMDSNYDTHTLWTGKKFKRYQKSRHIGKV